MGAGHIRDEHTLCHWTFDEALADNNGESIPNIGGTVPLLAIQSGSYAGFTDFSPVPGLYARKWFATNTKPNVGPAMTRVTSAGAQARWIGSWTVEMYLRLDKLPNSTNLDAIFGHVGSPTAGTEAENHLGLIAVNSSGKIVVLWEYGLGLQETLTQVNGSGPPVSNPENSGNGTWCHLMVTKNTVTKEVKIYLNGVLQDTLAYVNEPTGGTGGSWRVGANGDGTESTTGHRCSSFAMRCLYTHIDNVIRDAAWALANYELMSTTGLMNRDAESSSFSWTMDEAPTVLDEGPVKMHLAWNGTLINGDPATPNALSVPSGSLIDDGGAGRHLYQRSSLSGFCDQRMVDAFLNDFTFEGWFLWGMTDSIAGGGGSGELTGLFTFQDADDSSVDYNYIRLDVASGTRLRLVYEPRLLTGSDTIVQSAVGDTKWGTRFHCAVRKSVSGGLADWAVFINGVKKGELLGATNYGSNASDTFAGQRLILGATTSDSQPSRGGSFTGVMDDVIFYKNARTDQQILDDYNRGAGTESGPPVFTSLPMPTLNGAGDAVDVSADDPRKTIVASGVFNGATFMVEASVDGGTKWAPVLTIKDAGVYRVSVAAQFMRLVVFGRRSAIPFSAAVNLAARANDTGLFAELPMPASGSGPGAAVDTSLHGDYKSVVIDGVFTESAIVIEVSIDAGVTYMPMASFTNVGDLKSFEVTANRMRVNVTRRSPTGLFTPTVAVGSFQI